MSRILALSLAALFLVAIGRLARLDNGGPAHSFVDLPGQEPATMYLPGAGNPFVEVFPPPPAQRPAAVVLIHGFMSDRQMMSVLARRITQNGYAVLAIDVQGHGENRNPIVGGPAMGDTLNRDVQQAVDFLRAYPMVDGSRLVVMGHSMGAGAALDYATHDPALKGAVMISGGFHLTGTERPKNTLFIFAQNDPEQIQSASVALAAHLADVPQIDFAKTYGDFLQGSAVEAVQVPGVDHIQIVYSPDAAQTIVTWLDSTFGAVRTGAIDVDDPRLGASGVALVLFLLLLVPLGRVCGSMVPRWPERPAGPAGWLGVLIPGVALVAAMPLVAMIPPASFIPLVVGDVQISWFGVAGLILVGGLTLSNTLDWQQLRDRFGAALFAAAIAFAVIYVCQVPMSVTFHRLSFTPERLVVAILAALLLHPFWMGFELLVRRGGVATSTVLAVLGRVLILVLMGAGVSLGVLPFVLILVLPSLALISVMIEIFAAAAYSASGNLLLISLVETAWFAWVIAATNPITFMF